MKGGPFSMPNLEAIKQRLSATDYELGWAIGTIEAEV